MRIGHLGKMQIGANPPEKGNGGVRLMLEQVEPVLWPTIV